jgi:2',3'-cyclic-nucleotide 2'-phosphodiesterase (5'-nucleotidase family)
MLKQRIRYWVIVATALAAAATGWGLAVRTPSSAPVASPAPQGSLKVILLHANDSHGQLLGLDAGGKKIGGVARLATAVRQVRQTSSAERVFLIHCGDEFSRGDALTQQSCGAANIVLMNQLGYDLWVPGNGEFYNGVDVLQHRIAEAKFPTLAANVSLEAGRSLGQPYVIEKAGPVRIAFFGLCTVRAVGDKAVAVKAADPVETARSLVPRLRQEADVVVAVTHLGLPEDLRLASTVEGIDLILGGHSHTVLKNGFRAKGPDGREVFICQAGDHYRYLGRVDMELAPRPGGEGWSVIHVTPSLISLDETVVPDPNTVILLDQLSKIKKWPPRPATQPAAEPAAASAPSVPLPVGG